MRLEPLGAQQRHEQVHEQEHGDYDGQPDHGEILGDSHMRLWVVTKAMQRKGLG